jgi:hypothetical protein
VFPSKQIMNWKYEFLATREWLGEFVVVDSRPFRAADLAGAKSVLSRVVREVKVKGPTPPNAIRLIDPNGEEIWRAQIAGGRVDSRRRVRDVYGHHATRRRQNGGSRREYRSSTT